MSKHATAIFTADWHLRSSTPTCRTDDFYKTQWEKVDFIMCLAEKHNCPIYHAGDLFHEWNCTPRLLSDTINSIYPDVDFYTVYGNHDLPYHNMKYSTHSPVQTLWTAGCVGFMAMGHWGWEEENTHDRTIGPSDRTILVWHKFVWHETKPFPGVTAASAARPILRRITEPDVILTGDNHIPFVVKEEGRLLVNPGPITRQTTNDEYPRVYLYYAEDNTVEEVIIPHKKDAVSDEHIELVKANNERVTAFVERLSGAWEKELSFERNLTNFLETNTVDKPTTDIIYRAIGDK